MRTPLRLAVVGLLLLLFTVALGVPGLWERDEGRYAQAAREMRRSGDYLVPTLRGVVRLNKPPLFYWALAVSQAAFGENEFACRLPSAIAGVLTALLVFLLARRLAGETAGWFAAIVYSTCLFGAGMGRLAHPESFLNLFMTASLALFYTAYRNGFRIRRALALAWLCAGLGFLSKGPHGVLLPALVFSLFLLARRDAPSIKRMMFGRGLLIALLPVVIWGALVVAKQGWWVADRWVAETLGRVSGSETFHPEPPWFFAPVLLGGFFPWTLWFPAALAYFRGRGLRPEGGLFLLVWALVIFLFFSASSNKAAAYMLSAMPPLAMATGIGLARLAKGRSLTVAGFLHCGVAVAALAALAIRGLPETAADFRTEAYAAGGVFLATMALVAGAAFAGRVKLAVGSALSGMSLAMVVGVTVLAPAMNPLHSTRDAGLAIRGALREGDLAVNLGTKRAGLVWYADLPIERRYHSRDAEALWAGPRRVVAYAKKKVMERLTSAGVVVYTIYTHPARSYGVYSNRPAGPKGAGSR